MAWNIDPLHSQVGFSIKHMVVSNVKGRFNIFSGTLEIDEANPQNSRVEATVDATSVDTRDAGRDGHLRSPDFFDVEKFPTLSFKSTNVEAAGEGEYLVLGDLTIHGVTQPVTFKAEYAGQVQAPRGLTRAGLSAKATISRKDFGLTFNSILEGGGTVLSDKVVIELEVEAVQENVELEVAAVEESVELEVAVVQES